MEGFVQDHVGPELRFADIEIDQTFVREALKQIDAVVSAFPVRGKPYG